MVAPAMASTATPPIIHVFLLILSFLAFYFPYSAAASRTHSIRSSSMSLGIVQSAPMTKPVVPVSAMMRLVSAWMAALSPV